MPNHNSTGNRVPWTGCRACKKNKELDDDSKSKGIVKA